jgi:hypothetical protein
MTTRSPRYEEDGAHEPVHGLFVGFVMVVAAIGLIAMAIALRGFAVNSSARVDPGSDVHAPLRPAAKIDLTTEAGRQFVITVYSVEGGLTDPTVTVRGGDARARDEGAWTLLLDDGSQVGMTAVPGERPDETQLRLSQPLPEGRGARFLHFDPDNSHGDMYFDFQ